MLASNQERSYVIYIYNCGLLNKKFFSPSIGYSAGADFFYNHELSRLKNATDIACLNEPFTSWSNVVFNSESKC